ncbi:hypothetical protein M5D96_002865, partial [Drosophila gunungcola]
FRQGKHKLSSGSVSSKNPDESVSSKDRSNKVTKDKFEEDQPRKFCRRRCFVESSGHVEYRNGRNAKEKVFKTSFNHKEQSYHEIFEESKERQEKAERACRAYNINKSKLRRTLEVCGSGGPGSGNYESSWESEYSSKLTKSSQEYDNLSVQGQLQSINGNGRGDSSTGIPTTATSQSRSQRDYLSSGSTRHRLHHHNRRQRSVPKTYQDRGNSPINIKTRRKTHDYHELCSEIGTEKDIEISNIDHRSVTTEEDLDMYDDELTDNVDLELYDKEEAYNDEYSHDTEINDEKKDLSDEYDQFGQKPDDEVEYIKSDQELSTEYEQDLSLGQQEIFDKESEQSKKSAEVKPKSPLSLKIYNADEALMEIPEDFEGSAVVLDDDADFLDITLTDDEEQIRAKLMAAALTTRRSGCSISASSGLKSRRSTESRSSILSYKPSVIFTRRSEVIEDENVPRRNNRVALLAEQVLRSVSKSHTEEPEWQPLMEQVSDPELNKQPLAERELFKKFTSDLTDSGTPLCVDRQLLSKEFNKKLQRQLKSIVETFQ